MTAVDRLLQQWRIRKAKRFLDPGMRVLDIGCGEGTLLEQIPGLAAGSLGIDPTLGQSGIEAGVTIRPKPRSDT